MTLEWQRDQNGTHYAEVDGRRYSIKRAAGLREWSLKINGVFHSYAATLTLAQARADRHAERYSPDDVSYFN